MNKPFADNRIDYILNLISPCKEDLVLNIGVSNIPEIEMKIEKKIKECWTLDIDKKKLLGASKLLKNTKIINEDFLTYDFRNKKFDKIVILEVLEHIDNDSEAIKKIKRLLKIGGRIILSVPSKSFWHIFNPVLYLEHKRHYSKEDIIGKLEREGFIIEHFNYTESFMLLIELYFHLFNKFILRRNVSFGLRKKNRTYMQVNKKGLDLIVSAKRVI
jgi:SAM-dependent methyltransferase